MPTQTERRESRPAGSSAATGDEPIDRRDQDVLDSFDRCVRSEGFFETFYDNLMAKSPEIERKFAHTDMEKQKQVVMASLLTCLRMGNGDPRARLAVAEIGASHSRQGHNIRPELYRLWLDALCEAVRDHDRRFTPLLAAKWRKEMRAPIALITSMY